MNRRTVWAAAACVLATLAAVACGTACYPDYAAPAAGAGPVASTTTQALGDAGPSGTGLPCLVQALLEDHCQSCHSQRPSAPMPLMTYADLMAKAPSDPSKRVADVTLVRLESVSAPMPPSGLLAMTDISSFEDWVKAGAPRSDCQSAPLWDGGAVLGPECKATSDCPGSLTCVSGLCTGQPPPPPPPPVVDAGGDGGAVAFADPTSANSWTVADLTSLSTASTYNGATFDGRYVYFAPDGSSAIALRYDTTGVYSDPASWSTYSLTARNPAAFGYRGATFDGRYVYFVPSTSSAILSRFDTHGAFGDDAMWTLFDLNGVGAKGGLQGATFDGRFVYFAPSNSTALRYDTTGGLTLAASWSTKDLTTIVAGASGYVGGAFDGRYVYYAPNARAGVPHGTVARFDTQGSFAATTSWSAFDLTTVASGAVGFRTAAFDGRYLYLVPGWTAPNPAWSQSTVARFDTLDDFTRAAAWTTFDTRTIDPNATGYNSATFDGRFLVLAPGYDAASAAYHGRALVLDTIAPLGARSSWALSDTSQWSSTQVNLRGTVFDGKYMYFAPRSGFGLRFLRRATPQAARFPALGGSFY